MQTENRRIGYGTLTYYFFPLALQGASQSLTYPLVAIVAAHAEGGARNVAGIGAGMTILLLMGFLGIGLLTTGMVFVKSIQSYDSFKDLARFLGLVTCFFQTAILIPPLDSIILERLLHLEPIVQSATYQVLLIGIPMQFLFYIRSPYMVVLYNAKETMKAGLPSVVRMIVTGVLAVIFIKIDLVGPSWATVCLTLPVVMECLIYIYYAKPLIRELEETEDSPSSKYELFIFNVPISLSTVMLFISVFVVAAFINRSENGNLMYAIFVLVLGLVNPVSFAATKLQAIIILFAEETKGRLILPVYTFLSGLVLGATPLLFVIPSVGIWYYVEIQHLEPENFYLTQETAFMLFAVPITVAFRAYSEGLAALHKKTTIFMMGQGLYLATTSVVGFFALILGFSGNSIGAISIILANIASSVSMRLAIYVEQNRHKLKDSNISTQLPQ